MRNDEHTPECIVCTDHVGILRPSYLMLRGGFLFSEELGCEVFVFDNDVSMMLVKLATGQSAAIVDTGKRRAIALSMHESCFERLTTYIEAYRDCDDEEYFGVDSDCDLDKLDDDSDLNDF